ncbi:nuclear transcription factor Y subunit C-10-like [Mangifera indica]|uniref:nuclear transcription factor Y subunit C-10-like n=1 Tax=Mangifera indica TaxID=29780 RepID=UPI001CFA0345|nr:nuclear transcription factor Y subunit C-10-like [Mangifera indica]XP_044504658.1 nuclear transcription factor Y subunit C-10-like [Mangifera indica]
MKRESKMRKPVVDLNQSMEFTPSTPSPEVHNFMPMTPFALPYQQETKDDHEDEEDPRHSRLMEMQRNSLEMFWNQQIFEIHNTSAFKNNQLPLARIKRVMKSNPNVKMISADTPIVFSKACELFILELTLRAWLQTEGCKRRTLQRCDIARALKNDELFEFLADFFPFAHNKDSDGEKSSEEAEVLPPSQMHFSVIDINRDLVPDDQQLLMKPSFSGAELNSGSASS